MCSGSNNNGWSRARGLVVKTLVLIGGATLVKRFTKSTTRWDHARIVSQSLAGEKFSRDQASRDPDNFFNLRWLSCPAAEMVDGSKVLYFEQAFWRTPNKPFRQRFYMVKPCPKEMKCDVEVCRRLYTSVGQMVPFYVMWTCISCPMPDCPRYEVYRPNSKKDIHKFLKKDTKS